MARARISLTVSAFAVAVLTTTGASGQPQTAPIDQVRAALASGSPTTPMDQALSAAQSNGYDPTWDRPRAAQLFGFPSLSNKSAGRLGCTAGSAAAGSRPRVVATFPANGAVVRPGVVVVRVTFDQPMACDASFDGTSDLPNPCPGRWREVTISQDHRSFRTVCEVKADTRYKLTLRSFRNTHGLVVPAEVTFSTSGSAPVATILEALAEDTGAGMASG